MAFFLLTVEASFGEWQEFLTYTIEAENRQMVKYHFHYTLKDWGFRDTQWGKHCLEQWEWGVSKEIYTIEEIPRREWEVLDEHIYSFHKVAEQNKGMT